jgi:hypothetical protein
MWNMEQHEVKSKPKSCRQNSCITCMANTRLINIYKAFTYKKETKAENSSWILTDLPMASEQEFTEISHPISLACFLN